MKTRGGIIVVLFLLTILPIANGATETQISQTVIDPEPFRTRTVVASSGNGYLVAWGAVGAGRNEDLHNTPPMTIYIRAVGADGIPLQQSATAVGKGELPSIAWNGHEYLVVWGITTPTTGTLPTPSLVGIRVREDGTLIDPVPVTLIAEVNPYSYLASVTWSGSQYLVTWTRGAALVDTRSAREAGLPSGRHPALLGIVRRRLPRSSGRFLRQQTVAFHRAGLLGGQPIHSDSIGRSRTQELPISTVDILCCGAT